MRLSNRIVLIALAFVFMGTALAHAQKKLTNTLVITRPSEHLVVLSTAVDRANQTLTIQGLGFGAQPPQVWCETYLMTVMSATDSQLVVFLPGGVPDGTHLLTVVRGPSDKDRASFHMTVGTPGQGPAGAAGPAGSVGPAGPKGDTGAVGPAGAVGPKGDTGAVGPKGDTGAVGPKGDTGAAGPQGQAGSTGLQGETGAAGSAGPVGPAGPAGPVGPAGSTRAAGPAGPQGQVGAAGPQGNTGATGSQGAQGPQGPQGLMGPLGPQGVPGISGHQIVYTALTTLTLNGNATTTMNATCPVGKNVISGGYESSVGAWILHPVASFPPAVNMWRVTLRLSQDAAATFQFRVYAVCATT